MKIYFLLRIREKVRKRFLNHIILIKYNYIQKVLSPIHFPIIFLIEREVLKERAVVVLKINRPLFALCALDSMLFVFP